MIERLRRLFSPTALFVATAYAVAVFILLVAARRVADLEGRAYDLLWIGFPWVLAFRSDIAYPLAIALNIATVYLFALSVARIFGRNSK